MDNAHNTIQVLIAHEEPIFRNDVCRLLRSTQGLRVVGEASDASAVVTLTRQLKPQVLLLDLALLLRSEMAQLKTVASPHPPPRIIAMAQAIEKSQVIEALRLGAQGIVLKTATPTLLLSSIRDVAAGDYVLGSEVLTILVQLLRDFLSHETVVRSHEVSALTHRELEIIGRIAAGLSNKDVGREFSISERTVKHHLTNIFTKIGVSNRLALALFAVNHHLVTAPPRCGTQYDGAGEGTRRNGTSVAS